MGQGYQLLDSGDFRRLEQVGPYRLIRPAAQAPWRPTLPSVEWDKADAQFERFRGGDGEWRVHNRKLPNSWTIQLDAFSMNIKLTDFGHLGIFPEQHTNWSILNKLISKSEGTKVLNLFAYTGGSTLSCAAAGAEVVHVDASKTSVNWARENATLSGLNTKPIRWIVDDVQKFVQRELRRGSRYQGIILDPPSFGRGPKGEGWKIEDHLIPLLEDLSCLLADPFSFFLLSGHTAGYTPLTLQNLLRNLKPFSSLGPECWNLGEMTLSEKQSNRPLPSGASCMVLGITR